jgi:dTDP-4-dehydrorhamnose reductase
MKIVVTGAAGMLGSEVVAAANAVHHEVVGLTRHDVDVTNFDAVVERFERELPAVVVNCAAWTDVDGAEENEDTAYLVNADGAGNVAAAAAHVGARVIHISTDYVFDGSKADPYVESDGVSPLGAYGRSKLAGEDQVVANNPRHLIVRTSWLYGLHGKNFVETMLSLAERQSEILVVADQFGCPTYAGELAAAIVELADFEKLGVMHVSGGEVTTWFDFAREIFRQSRTDVKVLSGTTSMLGRPAPRPVNSAMVSERDDAPVLKRWDHGLHAYLVERTHAQTAEEGEALVEATQEDAPQ